MYTILVCRPRTMKKGPITDGARMDTIFGQLLDQLKPDLGGEAFRLPSRVWKVVFEGEGLDDEGGGYNETLRFVSARVWVRAQRPGVLLPSNSMPTVHTWLHGRPFPKVSVGKSVTEDGLNPIN